MRLGFWVIAVALAGVFGSAGWIVSDHLESDNRFCVSCHLDAATPLHRDKLADMRHEPARSLIAAHRRADAEFRCIDCHRGTGALGRLRVKLVAARDAANYVIGSFGEPDHMRHPLWDSDCLQCHTRFSSAEPDAFHWIDQHNVGFPFTCVECHTSHSTEGDPDLQFLDRGTVLPICQECHEEY